MKTDWVATVLCLNASTTFDTNGHFVRDFGPIDVRLKDFDSNSTSCCCVHCKPQKKTITKLSVVFRVANLAEIHVQLLATMTVFL